MPNLHFISDKDSLVAGDMLKISLSDLAISFQVYEGLDLNIGIWPSEAGFGVTARSKIVSCSEDAVSIEILETLVPDSVPKTRLIVAVPRPQILKRLLESLSCYPVSELILVTSEHTQKSYLQSRVLREELIEQHLRIGSLQAGYSFRPKIRILDKFSKLFTQLFTHSADFNNEIRVIADPQSSQSITDVWRYPSADDSDTVYDKILTTCAIGPEAGWSRSELDFFKESGFRGVKLADSVLRVDVAALSAMSQLYLRWMMIRNDASNVTKV
jgi:16S rRNA (uracil1498-N3)-methyltransferase